MKLTTYVRRMRAIVGLTLLSLSAAWTQSLHVDSLFSTALGRTMRYNVLLPRGHAPERLWPGMLLLHGFAGNETNWTGFTKIQQFARDIPLVIVMPQGNSAWYVNAKTGVSDRYEDFVMRDLRNEMAGRFGVDTAQLSIAGLSMGGYGSLLLALKHPRSFVFVAPLSSSLDIPMGIPELEQHGRQGMRPELERAFGKDSSGFWARNDPFTLASSIDTTGAPFFYIATGIQDEFKKRLEYHRSFVEILRTRGFRYEYHETPGRHNWEYWGMEIESVLRKWQDVTGGIQ